MSIKQLCSELLNKKWETEDLLFLIMCVVIASIFVTPILGIPIGVLAYYFLFNEEEN
ncbi:VraH family protein [Leuconostoc gelidum subsp. gasicomitatum]|uniref:VraH family peptide resistance protein n=1 Tax=Leuconostoc gasicomitatum TaxID=115778 RepID=UPI001CC6B50C|nr:VraH family protein [Leuconostoc gasicomitatum]MBZ5983531.1 VraH family protein [Leuconostoc gasicomitatum]